MTRETKKQLFAVLLTQKKIIKISPNFKAECQNLRRMLLKKNEIHT